MTDAELEELDAACATAWALTRDTAVVADMLPIGVVVRCPARCIDRDLVECTVCFGRNVVERWSVGRMLTSPARAAEMRRLLEEIDRRAKERAARKTEPPDPEVR